MLVIGNCKIFLIISFIFISGSIYGQSLEDGIIYLSKIIAEEKYQSDIYSDIEIVDSLYKEALVFYNNDVSEALLALTFATLPFNEMPVRIPILNIKLGLKLPSVRGEFFNKKRKMLPGIIYFDSRLSGSQDKDKVAHFFGNAFLSYSVTLLNASKFFGLFVEMFEDIFKVSGGIDFRDLQANYLGEFFGYSLRKDKTLYPSDFFNVYSLFYFSYN